MDKEALLKLIGAQIVKARMKKGWTQADLANACDKDPQSIERVENGKINASIFYLYQISTALDLSLNELLNTNS